jgi:hypothetical protein
MRPRTTRAGTEATSTRAREQDAAQDAEEGAEEGAEAETSHWSYALNTLRVPVVPHEGLRHGTSSRSPVLAVCSSHVWTDRDRDRFCGRHSQITLDTRRPSSSTQSTRLNSRHAVSRSTKERLLASHRGPGRPLSAPPATGRRCWRCAASGGRATLADMRQRYLRRPVNTTAE